MTLNAKCSGYCWFVLVIYYMDPVLNLLALFYQVLVVKSAIKYHSYLNKLAIKYFSVSVFGFEISTPNFNFNLPHSDIFCVEKPY